MTQSETLELQPKTPASADLIGTLGVLVAAAFWGTSSIFVKQFGNATGISALALLQKGLPVYIHRSVLQHERILVSAGKRGVNLRLRSDDLIRIVKARVIDAAD